MRGYRVYNLIFLVIFFKIVNVFRVVVLSFVYFSGFFNFFDFSLLNVYYFIRILMFIRKSIYILFIFLIVFSVRVGLNDLIYFLFMESWRLIEIFFFLKMY